MRPVLSVSELQAIQNERGHAGERQLRRGQPRPGHRARVTGHDEREHRQRRQHRERLARTEAGPNRKARGRQKNEAQPGRATARACNKRRAIARARLLRDRGLRRSGFDRHADGGALEAGTGAADEEGRARGNCGPNAENYRQSAHASLLNVEDRDPSRRALAVGVSMVVVCARAPAFDWAKSAAFRRQSHLWKFVPVCGRSQSVRVLTPSCASVGGRSTR